MPTIASSDTSLCVLAENCGCDKADAKHNFTPIYDYHWSGLREDTLRILEIGVKQGASLRVWEDYFPKAMIIGIDCDRQCKRFASDRSQVLIGDQTDPIFLGWVGRTYGPFDIIIDDGSHRTPDQVFSLETLWPSLSKGGWYAIEDLGACFMAHYGGGLGHSGTAIERIKNLADEMHALEVSTDKPMPNSGIGMTVAAIHLYWRLAILRRAGELDGKEEEATGMDHEEVGGDRDREAETVGARE